MVYSFCDKFNSVIILIISLCLHIYSEKKITKLTCDFISMVLTLTSKENGPQWGATYWLQLYQWGLASVVYSSMKPSTINILCSVTRDGFTINIHWTFVSVQKVCARNKVNSLENSTLTLSTSQRMEKSRKCSYFRSLSIWKKKDVSHK